MRAWLGCVLLGARSRGSFRQAVCLSQPQAVPIQARKGILRLVGAVAGGSVFSFGIRLVSGLLITAFILPEELGLFNGLALLLTYAPCLLGGVSAGLARELPIGIGRGDLETTQRLTRCTFWWAWRVGFMAGLVMAFLSVVSGIRGDAHFAAGFATFAFCVPCACLIPCLQACLKTRDEFVRVAQAQVLAAVVGLATVAAIPFLGFYGLCCRTLLMMAVEVVLLYRAMPETPRPRWDWSACRRLIATGIPIYAVSMAFLSWRSMDSVILLYLAGSGSLGLYAVAVLFTQGGAALTNALGQVLYPRMAEAYGRTGDPREALAMIWRPMALLGLAGLPVFLLAWTAVPHVIPWALPKYAAGVPAAQWACLSAYLGCFLVNLPVFNVVKRQDLLALSLAVSAAAFLAALPLTSTRSEELLVGVAKAYALGNLTLAIGSNVLAVWGTHAACRREPTLARRGGQQDLSGSLSAPIS